MKHINSMKSIYTVSALSFILLLASCATPETTLEQGTSQEPMTEEPQKQAQPTLEPDWFSGETTGVLGQGRLAGYASAPGSDPAWVAEGLFREAERNLVRWIDDEIEQVRKSLVEDGVTSLDDSSFIRILRKAVWTLEFDNGERQEEGVKGDNGVYYHFVRLEIPAKELWGQLEQTMKGQAPEQWTHFSKSSLLAGTGE